jgi:hypothetical protein
MLNVLLGAMKVASAADSPGTATANGSCSAPGFQEKVAVDLVRAEHQVVAGAEGRDAFDLPAAPNAGHRVVRMAEKQELGARRYGPLQRVPVDLPAAGRGVEREGDAPGRAPLVPGAVVKGG